MEVLKLVSLHSGIEDPQKNFISFGYYEQRKSGALDFTGKSESCELSDEELHRLVKPFLKQSHRRLK